MIRTIEELMNELEQAADDRMTLVYIDNRPPTALGSYRGYYNDLAIERSDARHDRTELAVRGNPFELNLAGWTYTPGHSEVSIKADPTVAELYLALSLAVGAEFEGYKGGQFTMYPDTPLWVSEHGECDHLMISYIEYLPGRMDMFTQELEW